MSISLYNFEKEFIALKDNIFKTDISEENRELILDFTEDCLTGWKVQRISMARVITHLRRIKILTQQLNKEWHWYDERDTKRLLLWMDEKYPFHEKAWSQHGYRISLRKFVTWIRKKYGYPEGYPNKGIFLSRLEAGRHAEEVKYIEVRQPETLRDPEVIPTDQEVEWISKATINPRDKAFIEMSIEHGERIGALGTRQIKHVRFDKLGALVTMHDKTFRGEPVRYISSTMYLRQWLNVHPFKDDPEAPIWIKLNKLPECNLECTPSSGQVVKQHYLKLTPPQIQLAVDILSSNEVVFHYRHSL
ncbi:MAG: hypothetical protein IBX40_04425 [Methanosarcinales archaeon]|nr:hypothetical protein [Methanosarcinales archaeon]